MPAEQTDGTAQTAQTLFDLPGSAAQTEALERLVTAPLPELMAADWAAALAVVEPQIRSAARFLVSEANAGRMFLPSASNVLRAFARPLADVKVLVMGQDPYPTPGHAVGLAFSVDRTTRPIPKSLANIYKELQSDLGLPPRIHGDLSAWADQGVLMLNRVLSVQAGAAGSHRKMGWEEVTTAAIDAVVERRKPVVAVLWGRDAQSVRPRLDGAAVIAAAHPSPLSAARGFFGSRPFSAVNESLAAQGTSPIEWELPAG